MSRYKLKYDSSFWKTARGKEILRKENPGVYKSLSDRGFFGSPTEKKRTASTYHDPTKADRAKRANQLLSVISKIKVS